MTTDAAWMADWTVTVGVSLDRAGRAVLAPGRLELLEEIERSHSISAAARQAGVSYRHAWLTIQQVNEAAGERLVEAATGGRRGGGARLTPHGRQAVAAFRQLQGRLRRTAAALRPDAPLEAVQACVRVAAAVSLEEVLGRLLIDYARQRPDVRMRTVFGASDELADLILEGAPADLFLSADARQVDRLETLGAVRRGACFPLTENTLVVLGPAGRGAPVRRAADLASQAFRRVALAVPSSPLGAYTRAYLEGEGLYDALLSPRSWRRTPWPWSRPSGQARRTPASPTAARQARPVCGSCSGSIRRRRPFGMPGRWSCAADVRRKPGGCWTSWGPLVRRPDSAAAVSSPSVRAANPERSRPSRRAVRPWRSALPWT